MLTILATHGPPDMLTEFAAYPIWAFIGMPAGLVVWRKARGAGMLAPQQRVLGLLAVVAAMPALSLGSIMVFYPIATPILMLVALMWSMPTIALLATAERAAMGDRQVLPVVAATLMSLGACGLAVWVNSWWSNDNDMTSASGLYTLGVLILPWFVFAYALTQLRTVHLHH